MIIIADLKNFTLSHKVYLVENDSIVNVLQTSVKDMPELLCELAHKNNPTKIILSGSLKYNANIKHKMENLFKAKFNKDCPFTIDYSK